MSHALEHLTQTACWAGQTSMQACLLIALIVLVQRVAGERLAPRWRFALWGVLLLRLGLPWTPPSPLSVYNLLPSGEQWQAGVAKLSRAEAGHLSSETGPSERSKMQEAFEGGVAGGALYQPLPGTSKPQPLSTTKAALSEPKTLLVPGLSRWLALSWLAGALLVAGCAALQSLRMAREVRRQRFLTDPAALTLLEDCKQRMGIHAYLALVETGRVTSPALFGVVRPRLLLPSDTLSVLTPEQLRHVFMHELAHLRRGDIALNWLMTLLQALHWFNPLVWYAFARMRAERELACDALALSYAVSPEEPLAYGRTFVFLLERFAQPRGLPSLAGVLERPNHMKRRITMIARFHQTPVRRPLLAVLLLLTLGVVSLTSAQTKDAPKPDKAELMGRVEDFFLHNFRDVTSRKSLEWGEIEAQPDGKRSIRYMYEAKIWDKDTIVANQVFTFDRDGNYVSCKNVEGYPKKQEAKVADPSSKEGMKQLVEGFFGSNYIDIASREGLEWGEVERTKDGNYAIRYKYKADIRGGEKGKLIQEIFTFSPKGEFVSVKKVDSQEVPSVTSQTLARPDVAIEELTAIPYPEGGLYELVAKVRNQGAVLAPKFEMEFLRIQTNAKGERQEEKIRGGGYGAGPLESGQGMGCASLPFALCEGINEFAAVLDPKQEVLANCHRASLHVKVKDGKIVEQVVEKSEGSVPTRAAAGSPMSEGSVSAIHAEDKIDLPFADDPALIGTWKSVDLVPDPGQFKPGQKQFKGELSLKELVILPEGKTSEPWRIWTKGFLIHSNDKTASRYTIQEIEGASYLFMEWKTGDYILRHEKPWYCVLKKD